MSIWLDVSRPFIVSLHTIQPRGLPAPAASSCLYTPPGSLCKRFAIGLVSL